MKFKSSISWLVIIITILSLIASATGLFSNDGPGSYQFKSLHGDNITIYGKGLYKDDALKLGPQARAQDAVTMFIGIPLLLISLHFARRNSLKGKLLLAGILGYFLYTYAMFTNIPYNKMFLVYILLMATSLYAFILTLMSFDMQQLSSDFSNKLPIKFLAGFQIFIAIILTTLWLSDLVPALINDTVPNALMHYSNMPIYSMDLGLVVPTLLLAAVLILKRRPWGYLLSAVMIIKSISMLTALTAMGIGARLAGLQMSAEMIIFPLLNLVSIFAVYLLFKNINKTEGV